MLYENLKDYFVNDLIYEDTEILFVLESPHNEEVKRGFPVAGRSGKDMSKVLFSKDEPLGKLISEGEISRLGIINISNYPLQLSAYNQTLVTPLLRCDDMKFFEKIRQNPKLRKHDKLGINTVVSKIMSNFKSRIQIHSDKKIILCGKFAEASFDSVVNELNFKEVLRVPHPSFNQWSRASNKEIIEKLQEFVK